MSDGIAGTGIKLGTTLYSMTSEFAAGLYTPETLIAAVAEEGIGPGIEFNIAQLLRTYPDVDDAFVKLWFDSIERYGLEPSAVGTNLDMGRRKDRDMTPDEEHDFLARQLKTAHTLGFKRVVIRSHGKELLRSLLPLAEKCFSSMPIWLSVRSRVGESECIVDEKSAVKPRRSDCSSSYISRICSTWGSFGPEGAWISYPSFWSYFSASGRRLRSSSLP